MWFPYWLQYQLRVSANLGFGLGSDLNQNGGFGHTLAAVFSIFFAKKKKLKRRSACPNPKLLLAYSDSIGVYWKAAESCVVSENCTQ